MRKYGKILVAFLLVIVCTLGLVACGEDDVKYEIKKATYANGTLSWTNVQVDSYTVKLVDSNREETVLTGLSEAQVSLVDHAPGQYSATISALKDGEEVVKQAFTINIPVSEKNKFILSQPNVAPALNEKEEPIDGEFVWEPVNKAKWYNVQILRDGQAIYTSKTENTFYTIPNDIAVGNYLLTVQACTDAENHVNSAISEKNSKDISIQKLATVAKSDKFGFDISSRTLKWPAVANASGYEIEIQKSNEEPISIEHYGKDTKINLSEYMKEYSAYKFNIRAISNSRYFIDGDFMETPEQIITERLEEVTNIRISNALLSWTAPSNIAKPDVEGMIKITVESRTGVKQEFRVPSAQTSFDLSVLDKGIFLITLSAYDDGGKLDASLASAAYSYKTAVDLAKPVVLSNKGSLTWGSIANATQYAIYENNIEIARVDATTNAYTFSANKAEGTYSVYVVALGDDVNFENSPQSDTLSITKEKRISNFAVEDSQATWDIITDIGFRLVFKKDGVEVDSTTINTNGFSLENFTRGKDPGSYTMSVYATKADEKSIDSVPYIFDFVLLDVPRNPQYSKGKITLKALDGVSDYTIEFADSSSIDIKANAEGLLIFDYSITVEGNSQFAITAKGDNVSILDSNRTHIDMFKLFSDRSVSMGGGVLTWTSNAQNSGIPNIFYEVKVNTKLYIVTGGNSLDLKDKLSQGGNTVSVRANATGQGVVPSEYTTLITLEKLIVPSIRENRDSKSFYWSAVNNATSYSVTYEAPDGNIVRLNDYNFTEYSTGTDLAEGKHVIRVVAIGNGNTAISSAEGVYNHIVSRLNTPQNVNLNEANISFGGDSNASFFEIWVNGVLNGVVQNTGLAVPNYEYSLKNLTDANIQVKIKAIGDGFKYISSNETSNNFTVQVTALKTPIAQMSNSILSWNEISYANGYIIKVYDGANVVKEYIERDAKVLSLDLSELMLVSNKPLTVTVKARGSALIKDDSDESNAIGFTVLQSVNALQVRNNVMTIGSLASKFRVSFKNIATGHIVEYITTQGVENISQKLSAGEYIVSAQAVSDEAGFVNSAVYTKIETIKKLANVTNLKAEGNYIKWDRYSAATKYQVVIFGSAIYDIPQTTSGDTVKTQIGGFQGQVRVGVVANGDGVNVLDSDTSFEVFVKKLDAPTNLKIYNRTVSWDAVTDARKYKIDITLSGEATRTVESNSNHLILDAALCPKPGAYSVVVSAVGNNADIYDSNPVRINNYQLTLFAPTNVLVLDNYIQWDTVTDAESYILTINGTTVGNAADGTDKITGLNYDATGKLIDGVNTISIVAVAKPAPPVEGGGTPEPSFANSDPEIVTPTLIGTALIVISFETNGGNKIPDILYKQGGTIVAPSNPTKTNYVFLGWYKDVALTESITIVGGNFTSNTTVYAKWGKAIDKIEVVSMPTKVKYQINAQLDITGGTIKVYYKDGSYALVNMTDAKVSTDVDMTTAGKKNVVVTYAEISVSATTTFEIEIS